MSRPHLPWWWIISLMWVGVISASMVSNATPAKYWLEVNSVFVHDSKAGDDPVMDVKRSIKQNFRGEYRVEVQRQQNGGGFLNVCWAEGKANYHTDASLPDPLFLSWWTYPKDCREILVPGSYRIETVWTIHPLMFFTTKTLWSRSNVFSIF